MELRVLRYFLAIAREQSISGAAQFLNVTQPTLSRQIMELEEELGLILVHRERGNRKIRLTEGGMLLRKRAEQIVDLVQKTQEELTIEEEAVSGTMYIGAGESPVFRTLTGALGELVGQYPRIHIHLYSGNADDVTERIDKGLLDFGLLIEPSDLSSFDYMRLPAMDRWGVLMRRDSPLAANESVQPEDLWHQPLICSRRVLEGGQLSSWMKMDPERLQVVATYNLLYNASLLVEAGLGYALCLDNLVNTGEESSLCFRPLSPQLESQVALVWKKYQVFSKPAQLFLEKIRSSHPLEIA